MRKALALATTLLVIGNAFAYDSGNPRPANWAQPIELKGVPNLHRITKNLYRSAQPDAEGMRNLKRMGIKTIINLRAFHSDRDEIGNTGLQYEHIYMKTWHPEKEDVIRFLRIVTDPMRSPVLVHCQHGADRTGTMSAIYRVVIEDWSKEDAVREMTQGGYNFHAVWSNLPPWIADLDVSEIRKELGINKNAKR